MLLSIAGVMLTLAVLSIILMGIIFDKAKHSFYRGIKRDRS